MYAAEAMQYKRFNFSSLLRQSGKVLKEIEQGYDVLLERRDGADMILTEASKEVGMRESLQTAARLITATLGQPDTEHAILERTVEQLPWLGFLPEENRLEFLREFAQTAAGVVETGAVEPLVRLEQDWMASARIYSDPKTRSVFMGPVKVEREYLRRAGPVEA